MIVVYQILEVGEIQERNGYSMVAAVWGRLFQAHHSSLSLNTRDVMRAQRSKRSRDGENEGITRLERDRLQRVEVDAA